MRFGKRYLLDAVFRIALPIHFHLSTLFLVHVHIEKNAASEVASKLTLEERLGDMRRVLGSCSGRRACAVNVTDELQAQGNNVIERVS